MPRAGIETLRTARLTLSRLDAPDWPEFRRMHTDPRVMATLGGVQSEAATRASFDRLVHHWLEHGFGWWAAREADGAFVGRGGLRRVTVDGEPELEIGYGFVADAWGRGYATELAEASARVAFTRIGAASVCAFTLPHNAASRRVMEKAGLRYERDIVWGALPHVLHRMSLAAWRARQEIAAGGAS